MSSIGLIDMSSCPRGTRCESCGTESADLVVHVVELAPLGLACMTWCAACAASDVQPPVAVSTAARLVQQHCAHLGIDLDEVAAALDGEGDDREVDR